MARTGLYDDPLFREHDAGFDHPERPERLDALREGIVTAGLEARLELLAPRAASTAELLRVHTEAHVQRVAATAGQTVRFDPDTRASPRSYEAALLAAGAVLDAVDRVLDGRLDRAFCAVRPPGHHALAGRAMGFCLINNIAIGAAHALARGLDRVLIVDWDVHHGNGTQAIFEREPRVLYVSSHAFPFYPGTGAANEVGDGPGRGFTVNLPLPAGCGDPEYARAYREIVEPIGRAFDPQLVMVSVGFDPFERDPLAPMRVTERGFGELTDVCLGLASGAAGGRAVFVLEGGYDLAGIRGSAAEVVRVMLGEDHTAITEAAAPGFDRLIAEYRKHQKEHWPL